MLHQDVAMLDIDVEHWRNLQSLLLDSARARRRIVLIHEDGRLLKFAHSDGVPLIREIDQVEDPHAVAKRVYHANTELADLVVVFERTALDRYFAQVQDSWHADEDIDSYVHRMYTALEDYPDGIVTHPGPAREQLGLQWRINTNYDDILTAVRTYVPPRSTIVLGVFADKTLWTSLILGFDTESRIDFISTADPDELTTGDQRQQARELVKWADHRHGPCSLGLFADREDTREWLHRPDKLAGLRELAQRGTLLADPVPEPLAHALATP
jgi:hypothetical protein